MCQSRGEGLAGVPAGALQCSKATNAVKSRTLELDVDDRRVLAFKKTLISEKYCWWRIVLRRLVAWKRVAARRGTRFAGYVTVRAGSEMQLK